MPSFLRNMSPQQRRTAIAVLIGGGLALLVLARRGIAASGGSTDPQLEADGPAGSSTFADNGQGLAQLGNVISSLVGEQQRTNELLAQRDEAAAEPPADATPVAAAVAAAAPAPAVATTMGPRSTFNAQGKNLATGRPVSQTVGRLGSGFKREKPKAAAPKSSARTPTSSSPSSRRPAAKAPSRQTPQRTTPGRAPATKAPARKTPTRKAPDRNSGAAVAGAKGSGSGKAQSKAQAQDRPKTTIPKRNRK